MKILILLLCLTFISCSSKNSQNSNSNALFKVKGFGVSGTGSRNGPVTGLKCGQPKIDTSTEILVQQMQRDEGIWVLKSVKSYFSSQSKRPKNWSKLDSKSRQQVDELIASPNELLLEYDLTKTNWRDAKPGISDAPYKLICTTDEPSENYRKESHVRGGTETLESQQSSEQNLNSTLPYLIPATDLLPTLSSSAKFQLKDGLNEEFNHEFTIENLGKNLFEIQQKADQLQKIGLTVRYYKISDSKVIFRMKYIQKSTEKLDISSNSTESINGIPINKDEISQSLKIPTIMTMIFEGTFDLEK